MKRIKRQSAFLLLLGTLTMASPCLVSCKDGTEITLEERDAARKEISGVMEGVLKGVEKLDVESSLKPCLKTSDYCEISGGGVVSDYAKMAKRNRELLKRVAAFKPTTLREEFRFLTKDQVLYTWMGKYEVALKTGEKYKTESQITSMLFSKINDQWKIVYDHTSIAPLVKMAN